MVFRVLVALAALIALAHADSTFNLRWKKSGYESVSVSGDDLKARINNCFSQTNLTVQFSYGYTYDVSSSSDTSKPGYSTISCANNDGRVDMYSDMVWAIPRSGGDGECFRLAGGSISNLKPDATKTTFNQNFKYAVTRNLQVCAYDSYYTPWNDNSTTTGRDKQNAQNNVAVPKISYQADTWRIYASSWNGALNTGSDWAAVAQTCAGNCDANTLWKSPSNWLKTSTDGYPSVRSRQHAFVPNSATNSNAADNVEFPPCVMTSSWRCPPGYNSSATNAKECGYRTSNPSNQNYKSPLANNEVQEQIACGSSPELLARSSAFNGATGVSSTAFTSPTATTSSINSQKYLFTFAASALDSSIGIGEDIIGTNGLWSKIAQYAPTITHFDGRSVSSPVFSSKTFWLNNANSLKFKFANANSNYQQIGFSGIQNGAGTKNTVRLSTSLQAGTSSPPLQQVAFNRDTQEATFLAEKDLFSLSNQGSGDFGAVGNKYWARVQSSYDIEIKFFCNNIGTDPNSGTTGYPYRFNCDNTLVDWTTTPGQAWNTKDNVYPTLQRQFTSDTTRTGAWADKTISATSDPVYLGMFASATNAGYSVATAVPAVNGSPKLSQGNEIADKSAVAQEDQADGVALIGAGVVTLAVLGSLSICIGAAILGKLQAK